MQDQDKQGRRVRELKEKLERLNGGPVPMGFSADCPLEVQERFLEHVLRYEETKPLALFEVLTREGVKLPPPEELNDALLNATLWEIIHRMAMFGAYLENTDHLSDRELYRRLWAEILHDPVVLLPEDPHYGCHCDIIGDGSRESVQLWLRHYADEEDRQRWAEAWPDEPIPEHQPLPYDRDRHLPRAQWTSQTRS